VSDDTKNRISNVKEKIKKPFKRQILNNKEKQSTSVGGSSYSFFSSNGKLNGQIKGLRISNHLPSKENILN
jgi:hypothetical protein